MTIYLPLDARGKCAIERRATHMVDAQRASPPRLVNARILDGSLEAAEELGIDINSTLREFQIDPRLVRFPEGFLTHHQVINFLETIAQRFQCPHFGFLVGKHQPPLQFGQLNQLLRLSPNLEEALANAARFEHFYSEAPRHELRIENNFALFIRHDAAPQHSGAVQLHTLGIVQIAKILQELCGPQWRLTSVSFAHAALPETRQYQQFFKCPVDFDQEFDALIFPEQALRWPIASADADLLEIVLAYFESLQKGNAPEEDIIASVRLQIKQQLGTNACNLVGISQLFNMHPRSLQRALADRDVAFKDILSDVRMELAEHYLRHSKISLAELTGMLGYNNLSAFSRAFKNRHGVSPNQWRA